jgi:predicted nucleotidyltransferase
MQVRQEVQERYHAALAKVTARLEEDYYVLAAVLYGSLARGEAWEKSDIDLMIILRDGQERANREWWLVEDDINIFAFAVTRNEFKRSLDKDLQGSFMHSIRAQFKILFSKDETIEQWLTESSRIGEHDRAFQLLESVANVPGCLDKAQKWFLVKQDLNYAFLWILFAVHHLARIEVVLNGEAPGREVLDQALKMNPGFFQRVYIDLINGPKTHETIQAALDQIDSYLEERAGIIFKPILDYLAGAQGPCTASDLNAYFKKKVPGAELYGAFEWLARRSIIHKLSSPVRLTRKSTISLEEPAYYYEKDELGPDGKPLELMDWE